MNKTKTRNLEEKNWEVKLGKMLHTCWTEYYTPRLGMLKSFYYIDTDEIPRLFLLLNNKIFIARRRKILFLSFTWEDIGVAVVTNMISQLQESLPFRHAAGFFEISFTKWLRGAKTVQLPVTFSISCQIFTSILFTSDRWPL